MQFTKIMIAVATLAAVGVAAAVPAPAEIAISSGASASKGNLAIGLGTMCTTAGGVMTEFTNGTSNLSTYVCAPSALTSGPSGTYSSTASGSFLKFAGTQFSELRLNVSGGSFTAICQVYGWPSAASVPPVPSCPNAPDNYVNPAATTLSVLEAEPAGSLRVGGLMDVEPNGFTSLVRTGLVPANLPGNQILNAGFSQTFGVAVSNDLYTSMFNDQVTKLGMGCTLAMYNKPECVPVIGKAQMASIMSSAPGDAGARGANFLAPSTIGFATPLIYARRVNTSGTQAAAQQYFLGNVCNASGLTVVPGGQSTPALTVLNLGSTGNVRNQLGQAGFSIGIMSGENNQAESWKWIRVGGMSMSESAQPADGSVTVSNTATALDGRYDYWFLSRVARAAAVPAVNFWTPVIAAIGNVPAGTTRGLFKSSETLFTKGLNACQPVATN